MEKRKNIKIRLEHSLYDTGSIRQAISDFSEVAMFNLKKNANYSEISITKSENENIAYEFANYALFLTIQSK